MAVGSVGRSVPSFIPVSTRTADSTGASGGGARGFGGEDSFETRESTEGSNPLQEASDALGGWLQGASDWLTDLLNRATGGGSSGGGGGGGGGGGAW